jgi:hypothetical protein
MKYYKNGSNQVFAFESDGSQDAYISPSLIPITQEQADALRAPSPAARIEAAYARINAAYEADVTALNATYPQGEVDSWTKQELEAREKIDKKNTETRWLKAAAAARRISVENLAALIIQKADQYAPLHGALTGKRQRLRDAIYALGSNATQAQLDAIQWNT